MDRRSHPAGAAAIPPAAPTGLTAQERSDNDGDRSIILSWTAPSHSALTGYRIWRGPDADTLAVLVDDTAGTSTTYTDSHGPGGCLLHLRGDGPQPGRRQPALGNRASLIAGARLPSSAILALPARSRRKSPFNPVEISELTLSSERIGYLTIEWSPPDPVPDCYLINWAEDGQAFAPRDDPYWNYCTNSEYGTREGFGASIVDAGKTYQVRVRGEYRTGENGPWNGPWTETGVQRVRAEPPEAPTALRIASLGSAGVELGWSAPSHSSITGYQVFRDDTLLATTAGSATGHTDAAPADGVAHVYAVAALSPDGDSHRSGEATLDAPSGFESDPTAFTVTLTWSAPDHAGIAGYQVLRGTNTDALTVIAADTGSTATEYLDDTVEPETAYYYAVRARHNGWLGPQSAVHKVITLAAATLVGFFGPETSQHGRPAAYWSRATPTLL